MREFSELAPGDLLLWQSATWQKIAPIPHPELRYAPAYNAMKLATPPDEPPVYTTMVGWFVVIEPSDVAELPALTPTQAFAQLSDAFGHHFAEVEP